MKSAPNNSSPAQRAESVVVRGEVIKAFGGVVYVLVDRDTDDYPPAGARVEVRLIDGSLPDRPSGLDAGPVDQDAGPGGRAGRPNDGQADAL